MTHAEAYNVALKHLGRPGPILYPTKQAPEGRYVAWNANVCIASGKLWHGDIDMTPGDCGPLLALAHELGEPVYVLREMDGRFENEAAPLIDQAIYTAHPG